MVRVTPCGRRSNSSIPRYRSSLRTRWATAPGVTPSSRAAFVKLAYRPAASKTRIASSGGRRRFALSMKIVRPVFRRVPARDLSQIVGPELGAELFKCRGSVFGSR